MVGQLLCAFLGGLAGHGALGPNLAVRVRVRAAHHGPFVLKNLNVANVRPRPQRAVLVGPHVHYAPDVGGAHFGQGQVVARREADDAAHAAFRFGPQQPTLVELAGGHVVAQGSKVVVENEGAGIIRIWRAVGAHVAGAEVAGGVVRRTDCGVGGFLLALPGAQRPVRRHQQPFAVQGIVAPVGVLRQVERRMLGHKNQLEARAGSSVDTPLTMVV